MARTVFLALKVFFPPPGRDRTNSPGPLSSPLPLRSSIPFFSKDSFRPLPNALTTLSFLYWAFLKSRVASPAAIPHSWAFSIWESRLALRSRALVGIQPVLRHTPPSRPSSTRQVFAPPLAARKAAEYPPGPEPIMAKSNSSIRWPLIKQGLGN